MAIIYRFTTDGRSRSTGHRWKEGDPVPPGLPITEFMLLQGIVEKVEEEQPESYEDMTYKELADELRERDLKISGNKQEKIDRLYDDDKGGK